MILLLAGLALAEDVYVSSDQKGLAILLDGAETGLQTPANLTGVRPGAVTITVLGECVRGEARTNVVAGLTTRVNVPAVTQLGTMSVSPTPSQARVMLDDRPWPGTVGAPVALPCGPHTVSAELTGYVPALVAVDLHMDQELDLPIVLSKLGIGTIELSAQPRNATITLDGKPVGSDAVSLPSVFAGAHTIGANLDGYKSAKKQIVVSDGDSQAWHFELARESSRKDSEVIVIRPGRGTELMPPAADEPADPVAASDDAEESAGADARKQADDARQKAEADARKKADDDARRQADAEEAARRKAAARAEAEAEAEQAARERAEADARREADAADARREADAHREEEEEDARREAEEQAEAAERTRAADEAARASKAAAAKTTSSKTTSSKTTSSKTTSSKTSGSKTASTPHTGLGGTKIAGITSLGLGLGSGGAAGYFMVEANQAYRIYNAKIDAARSQSDAQLSQQAQAYYNRTVIPRRTALYVSGGAAGALLVGGTVLMFVDERAPGFTPLPGGGMITWGGHF